MLQLPAGCETCVQLSAVHVSQSEPARVATRRASNTLHLE